MPCSVRCYTVSTQQTDLFSTRSVYDVSQVPGWLPKRELKRKLKLSNNAVELFTYLLAVRRKLFNFLLLEAVSGVPRSRKEMCPVNRSCMATGLAAHEQRHHLYWTLKWLPPCVANGSGGEGAMGEGEGEGVPVGLYLFPLRCTSAHRKLHMYTT